MHLILFLYISTIVLIEIQYALSMPLYSTNESQRNVNDNDYLVPKTEGAYFLNDNGRPVFGLFNGVNPARSYKSERENIQFHLFTNLNPNDSYQLFVDDIPSIKASPYNPKYETKILIHGFANTIKSEFVQTLKNEYLKHRNVKFNVIVIDWGNLCVIPWYFSAMRNTLTVGQYVAKFVDILVDEMDLKLVDLHILGHSLGAHTGGIVGKHIKSPTKIARITGLDPALPGYTLYDDNRQITKNDAEFVDIIHTCGENLGFFDPIGHIDFYPNGGVQPQPGCTLDFTGTCSHSRSWKFYSESIHNMNAFTTIACANVKEAEAEQCNSYGTTPNLGEHAYYSAKFKHNLFYTKTNKKPPYSTS